ncbi:PREDICTED: uncharacterized protein LOC109475747 [Branchiostoma belcheri]|uniref:Uncharacterized protein LOC109475747 n=1 Tax=Branchiostoma belcheri TaxID=7741 RepID=A0A6P4ZLZ2_BRABE|nr:PREDICTED: uncharacterized protein LOC109475747 [Branchiostoma belcheri]
MAEVSLRTGSGNPACGDDVPCSPVNHETSDVGYEHNVPDKSAKNPNPMYKQQSNFEAEGVCNPNPMYLRQAPMSTPNVRAEATEGNPCIRPCTSTQQDENNVPDKTARNPNPMYKHSSMNSDRVEAESIRNPNTMYPQQVPMSTPNVHAEATEVNPCIQPCASTSTQQKAVKPSCRLSNTCTEPRATTCHDDDGVDDDVKDAVADPMGQTADALVEDSDIEPYAVAYMDQHGVVFEKNSSQAQPKPSTSISDDIPRCHQSTNDDDNDDDDGTTKARHVHNMPHMHAQNAAIQRSSLAQNALLPNPMYGQNALNPNPMYVPNVPQERGCTCTYRRVCVALVAAIVLVLVTFCGTLAGIYTHFNQNQKMSSFNSSLGEETSTKITFGERGSEPGKFRDPRGVALSSDEIFVSDMKNKRVQVFSMAGEFLRLFSTVLPGAVGDDILPGDVAIDGDGLVWVVGRHYIGEDEVTYVVQYDRYGLPLTMFDVPCWTWYPNIAVDPNNNKIIVDTSGEMWMFHTNGTFERRFGEEEDLEIEYVATNKDGGVLVTNIRSRDVYLYTGSGSLQFKFGSRGKAEGTFGFPRGICTDSSGNIIVANQGNSRVDMFTSRGEFVRTGVSNFPNPFGIALGPDGQLAVTNVFRHSITIFPRRMVFP